MRINSKCFSPLGPGTSLTGKFQSFMYVVVADNCGRICNEAEFKKTVSQDFHPQGKLINLLILVKLYINYSPEAQFLDFFTVCHDP